MTRHWSERLTCRCGASFRSYGEEAVHRHNFPALCRAPRTRYSFRSEGGRRVTVHTRKGLEEARALAVETMDRRAEARGDEAPVNWGLSLVDVVTAETS